MPLASIHENLGVRGSNRHPWRGGEIWASRRSRGVIQGSPRSYLRRKTLSDEITRVHRDIPPPLSASSAADAGKPRAVCCARVQCCSPASSSRPQRSRSSHAGSRRCRLSSKQRTAANHELVSARRCQLLAQEWLMPEQDELGGRRDLQIAVLAWAHGLVLGGSPGRKILPCACLVALSGGCRACSVIR